MRSLFLMHKLRLKRLRVIVGLVVILATSCSAPLVQNIVAQNGWPAGWLADGSQLLINPSSNTGLNIPLSGQPFIVQISDTTFQRLESPWDFSKIDRDCVRQSPDGKSILYTEPARTPTKNLYRWDVGEAPVLLLTSDHSVDCPAWSPDGQQLVVPLHSQIGISTLRLMDRNGDHQRDLFTKAGLGDPAWSPDGTTIAIDQGYFRILLVEVNSGREITTAGFPIAGMQPTWSLDGQRIAYIEPVFGRWYGNLVVMTLNNSKKTFVAGTKATVLSEASADDYVYTNPMWSPRGDCIAVRRIRATVHDFQEDKNYEVVLIQVPNDLK